MNEVPPSSDLRTVQCPGGPLLVRGAREVVDAEGETHAVTRPVVAVCACDRSQRQPWCDGTHKALERGRRRREENESGTPVGRLRALDDVASDGRGVS